MDAAELLKSQVAGLPRPELDGPYRDRLRSVLQAYLDQASLISAADHASLAIVDALPRMRELASRIRNVHDAALQGNVLEAHRKLASAMAVVSQELDVLRSKHYDHDALGTLYRLRVADQYEHLGRKEAFHVPFQLRHIVAPQRYSMLGLPMLYLGSSLFVCWEEMGRLSFDRLWVSALKLREGQSIRLLDFGPRPSRLGRIIEESNHESDPEVQLAIARAVLWPLIAACSFPRRHQGAAFVEEYLVPQLVLAFCANSGFDGVRYTSNRVRGTGGQDLTHNYVLPAQPSESAGHCPRLTSLFEMTQPMPWSVIEALGPPINHGAPLVRSRRGRLEAYAENEVWYGGTAFARIEAQLALKKFGPVA